MVLPHSAIFQAVTRARPWRLLLDQLYGRLNLRSRTTKLGSYEKSLRKVPIRILEWVVKFW